MKRSDNFFSFNNFSLKRRKKDVENRRRPATTPLAQEFALYRQERQNFYREREERERKKLEIYETSVKKQTMILEKLAEKWLKD